MKRIITFILFIFIIGCGGYVQVKDTNNVTNETIKGLKAVADSKNITPEQKQIVKTAIAKLKDDKKIEVTNKNLNKENKKLSKDAGQGILSNKIVWLAGLVVIAFIIAKIKFW